MKPTKFPARIARRRVSCMIDIKARAMLDDLVATGLFGATPSEVARRLIEVGLKRATLEGWPGLAKAAR